MIATDLCMPAKPTSKSWSCHVATSFQERAEAMAEAFYYLLRALCIDQECQFAMAPDFFFSFKSF